MTETYLRPDPDTLLSYIQREESQGSRGKLKIFLGYVAGVGKTYAMLEAAHQRKTEGVDVAVGYIETHARPETENLLKGLELIPRKQIEYRGMAVSEMDLDAVLIRQPHLALVDELAHTNAPGSRHPKRYQDVLELLAAGIDVYTTLNIQHLESLNDVVAQITGVVVRETIPDTVIDQANEIELIDLPTQELLQRLKEGKVYVPEQASRAIQKFFRQGNLTALREITMRRAAEQVDEQMRAYMQTRSIPGPWPAAERLLVCVSSSPLSERLVRTARRLADNLNADWFAVYVEGPQQAHLSPANRNQVERTLRIAEELGAQVVTLSGHSIPDTVITYARQHNITKVIAGRPLRPRWQEWLRGSVVDQLIRKSANIDVYVISSEVEGAETPILPVPKPHSPRRNYIQGMILVAIATGLNELIFPFVSRTDLAMLYLAVTVITALYLGRGPSILAAALGVLAFNFFFVPPEYTFIVHDSQYLLTFLGMFIIGLVVSTLAVRVREQAEAAWQREAQTAELYSLTRDLAAAVKVEDIVQAIIKHVQQTFGREVIILLPHNGKLAIHAASPGFYLDENEQAVADWSFRHGQPAGRDTDTLPSATNRYLPFKTTRAVLGVLGVKAAYDPQQHLTPEQRQLMETFISQTAVALERVQLAEAVQHVQLVEATEKLQTALLNSISHDLRTPLASITGALSSLQDDGALLDDTAKRTLINNAWEEADRLNSLVGNLLDMTRLESGALKVKQELCDIQDLIGVALAQLNNRLGNRPIQINIPSAIPLVPMDFVLMVQVLVNLLDNAIKYSPPDSHITIQAEVIGPEAMIKVIDRGIGIPDEDLARIFDKFYRASQDQSRGVGLGLSISKGIVEVQGGRIWAENFPGGGAVFTVTLPLGEDEVTLTEAIYERA
jgi:two-component system sensor histidine kinase KdpD